MSRAVRRLLICLVAALFGLLVGPKVFGPRSRAAGKPFEWHPPEHFVPVDAGREATKAWVAEATEVPSMRVDRERSNAVRAVLHHSPKEMSVEEADLGALAREMASAFEGACTWVHRRHELRRRTDGAAVGLIEGDCDRDVDLGGTLPKATLRARKMQLMFPDDTGTSIVTISYPTDQAARWEPLFEATVNRADGVATRAAKTPTWLFAACAAAAALLAWFATAIAWRRR